LNEETCTFTVTINIAFDSGADAAYRANAERAIEDFWNNAGGNPPTYGDCKCLVKFEVNTKSVQNCDTQGSTDWHCIKVTPYASTPPVDTNGKKYIGYMYPPGVSTGQNLTGWWSDAMDGAAPGGGNYADFAHEAGHLMGLEDGDGGIMSNTTPGQATQTQGNIDEIMRDVCGGKNCPDRCCCGNGVVEKAKGEECDPLAQASTCGAGQFCCPYCCKCEKPQCDPAAGEYASKADCEANCKSTEGNAQECVYSYWSGCWFCIPQGLSGLYPEASSTNPRGCEKCSHGSAVPPMPEPPKTTAKPDVGEEMLWEVTKVVASSPVLATMFGNERANVYLENGEAYYVVFSNGRAVDGGKGELPDPTMNIYMSEQTAWMIYYDDIEPTEALKRNLITYEGVGFVEGFKFWASDFFFDVFVPYEGPGPNQPPEEVLVGGRIY
jgi:hypothetical protein